MGHTLFLAALINVSGGMGYLLPALVGVESMGIPSPGETALILAGVLASKGKLQIELVIVIACLSAIIGDNIGYFVGRYVGRDVLEGPGPFQSHRVHAIAAGDRFFEKHGGKAVFLGRWVALVRISAAWMAGITEMKFSHFFFWNALGGITWATTVALVAYFAGNAAADALGTYGIYAAGAGVVITIGVYLWHRRRARDRAHTS
jgi:membrane protein DedA with SNARE-associated domain